MNPITSTSEGKVSCTIRTQFSVMGLVEFGLHSNMRIGCRSSLPPAMFPLRVGRCESISVCKKTDCDLRFVFCRSPNALSCCPTCARSCRQQSLFNTCVLLDNLLQVINADVSERRAPIGMTYTQYSTLHPAYRRRAGLLWLSGRDSAK